MENCRKLLHHFHLLVLAPFSSSDRDSPPRRHKHTTQTCHTTTTTQTNEMQPIKHTSQSTKLNMKTKVHQKHIDRSWIDVPHFHRIYSICMSSGVQFTQSLFHNLVCLTASGGEEWRGGKSDNYHLFEERKFKAKQNK